MACKDCVHVRKPMRGFYNQVYCDYLHIHVSDQPYYDASKRCNGYKTKQTNADRIRAMTDEELADELLEWYAVFYAVEWSRDMILDWLKQECDDNGT